jgi:hypothetical protein
MYIGKLKDKVILFKQKTHYYNYMYHDAIILNLTFEQAIDNKIFFLNIYDTIKGEGLYSCENTIVEYDLNNNNEIKKQITQKEWFSKINTDHLLSLRYKNVCSYPRNENDKDCGYKSGNFMGYYIDKNLLYEELSKRPHRIRKKDRRKIKKNEQSISSK